MGREIVISGISGRFPESENLNEFWKNLINGVDMISEDDRRWTPGLNGLPTRSGKIKTLDKFDAQFFGVHPKQADFMDPQLRMLLEVTHEAIRDAGVNPATIRGSRTGVFVGASVSESEKIWFRNSDTRHGYALTGTHRGMLSNRVSFSFDFQGPSFTVDTACSSSLTALEQAVASIRLGHCDAAIVAGTHLCLEPNMSLQFHRLSMLSPEGKCKSFDASGNGYVRSEAVVAIYIQKKDDALRSYASVLAARANSDGYKEKGVTYPSGEIQAELLEETYRDAGIDPKDVVYVEAHGTGTQAGDPQELNAITKVFCKNREKDKPLLIGSVKSNSGHAEPASGLMSMAKVLLAMQQGTLPANLHYKTPNPNIPALQDGRLKVVAQNEPWNGGLVGMNSFGFGGANVHVILKSNHEKIENRDASQKLSIPLLIPFSGRTKESVKYALTEITKDISSKKSDSLPQQQLQRIGLLQKIANSEIPGHAVRGHTVITDSPDSEPFEANVDIQEIASTNPPVWFIFNGMGSQWSQMGRDLLKFTVCQKSIHDSAAILKPRGIDLMSILTKDDDSALTDSVIKSFIAITSVQVALVGLLRSLGVTPTGGIIGHSVGELGASYADDCFTASQAVLSAWARGKAISETAEAEGAMAAVGLTWEEAKQKCPPGIYPACHNAKDSVTISGPKKDIGIFVQTLKNEGVFAKEVNSSKMAFHSKYIEPAKPKLKSLMDEIIPSPKPRSARWISSSIPENEWNSPLAQLCSADYHVNNLLSPVLFQEALQKIPEGSLIIEIGPHALLQSIFKRSLPTCTNVGLLNKTKPDNSVFLLQAIGKLYNSGLNLNVSALYPPVEFPVAVDTPSISPLIKWDHSLNWDVPRFPEDDSLNPSLSPTSNSGQIVMEISLNEESQNFYKGHKIDGRIIFPATGYLLLIWRAFSSLQKKHFEQVRIVLENVKILRATVLPLDGAPVKFRINILEGAGEFEIQESGAVVVNGIVRSPNGNEFLPLEPPENNSKDLERILMSHVDAYKELRLRGYEYGGPFKGIHISDAEGGWAKLKWEKNWVSFLDTFLQVAILHKDVRALYLPTYLDKVVVDPLIFFQNLQQQQQQEQQVNQNDDETKVPIFNYPDLNVISCGGIQFHRLKTTMATRRNKQSGSLRLEKFQFTPYFEDNSSNPLSACLDVVLENLDTAGNTLKILEILGSGKNETEDHSISPLVRAHVLNQPTKNCKGKAIILGQSQGQETEVTKDLQNSGIEVTFTTKENEVELIQEMSSSADLIITSNEKLLTNLKETKFALRDQGFLLYHKNISPKEEESSSKSELDLKILEDSLGLFLIAHKTSSTAHFCLFKKSLLKWNRKEPKETQENLLQVVEINLQSPDLSVSNFNYSWIEELKMAMQKAVDLKNQSEPQDFRIYLISKETREKSGQTIPSGVLGLVNSLRKEPGGDKIRCFFLRDSPIITADLDFLKPSKNLSDVLQRDLVMNVFEENVWGSMRFYSIQEEVKKTKNVEHAYLNVVTRGDLSSLRWFESSLKYHEPQSEIVNVYYAPLNFRDVMLCSGKLALDSLPNNLGTKDCILGLEWSGKTRDGVRLMGLDPRNACTLATSFVPDPEFSFNVPEGWTLAEAATVPMAYGTAYYALAVRGKIQKGESVLIHAGAGGVGMAAIRIALSMNCKVYTTVGSEEKRDFLKKTFPQLEDSSFSNSRDSSFLEHILRETRGRGVDLVLNSLAGDKLQASIKCMAMKGRFLEIGKVDLFKNTGLGMAVLLKNVSVDGILIDGLEPGDPEKKRIQKLVEEGINSGAVQPLNSTIFTNSVKDVEQAFRFMASGKHFGKIMIEIRKEGQDQNLEKNSADSPTTFEALSRTYFDPKKCYIIIGGLGGFGLELCGWLIGRGAKKLALVSRSGVRNGYQYNCLRKWRKEGVTIITPTTDITTLEGVTTLLQETTSKLMAPVGGIFNLAMVLADGVVQNQTPESFQTVSRPKINSTMLLDQVSRTLAPSLEYFVVFSSILSGRGAPGLSNYAWANSGMERICENRQKDGLPGTAIMWGAVGDVGVLQEAKKMGKGVEVGGTISQSISSCLNTLDILLNESNFNRQPVLSSIVLPDKTQKQVGSNASPTAESSGVSLMEKVGNILGIKGEAMQKVNPQMKLQEIGMDSLMSVEIKQLLEMTAGIILQEPEVLELTFSKLKSILGSPTEPQTNQTTPNSSDPNLESYESTLNLSNSDPNPIQRKSVSDGIVTKSMPNGRIPTTNDNLESLGNNSKLYEPPSDSPSPFKYLYMGVLLLCSFMLVIFLYIPLRWGYKIYLKVLCTVSRSEMKVSDRPFDDILASDPNAMNMVLTVTCEGTPNKSQLIQTLEERLIHWKTNIRLDRPTTESDPLYEPYERLQWRLEQGPVFNYWTKVNDFSMNDRIIFEEFEETAEETLETRTVKTIEFYTTYDWSKEQDQKRPQWQFCIISPKIHDQNSNKSKEFCVVMVLHHSMGDALSLINLVQYAVCDRKQQVTMTTSPLAPKKSPGQSIQDAQKNQGQQTLTVLVLHKTKENLHTLFSTTCHVLRRIHHLNLYMCQGDFHLQPLEAPPPHRHYQWIQLSLDKFKSARDPQSLKMYPTSAVILTCATVAFEKVYEKAGKLEQLPKEFIYTTTGILSPYQKLGLINNMVTNRVFVPVQPPSGRLENQNENENDNESDYQVTKETLCIQDREVDGIRKRVKAVSIVDDKKLSIEKMQGVEDFLKLMTFYPSGVMRSMLQYYSIPTTHAFSNVPALFPRNYTYFGGHKLKHFHGTTLLTLGNDGVIIPLVDSANNTIALSLLVDDRSLEISQTFLSDFFCFFQQAFDKLSNK